MKANLTTENPVKWHSWSPCAVEDERLTITEVADILRAPVATLRYWRHLGTGPHSFRIGRGVRYWHHNVTTWLQQQSSTTGTSRPRTGR